MVLKKLFGSPAPKVEAPQWQVSAGARVYAIGDIHGRIDLLDDLLDQIAEDDRSRPEAKTSLVFLGDLIDRGAGSRAVVERVMALSGGPYELICLQGNHEQLLLNAWDGDRSAVPTFHRAGCRATLISYGVSPEVYDNWDFDELLRQIRNVIPETHIEFIRQFRHSYRNGDYLFVHAGIRPGVPLAEQRPEDLTWIRHEFTHSDADHGVMVIHGHSIRPEADIRHNRIGIDTGAYASGILTAIALEDGQRRFLTGRETH